MWRMRGSWWHGNRYQWNINAGTKGETRGTGTNGEVLDVMEMEQTWGRENVAEKRECGTDFVGDLLVIQYLTLFPCILSNTSSPLSVPFQTTGLTLINNGWCKSGWVSEICEMPYTDQIVWCLRCMFYVFELDIEGGCADFELHRYCPLPMGHKWGPRCDTISTSCFLSIGWEILLAVSYV